jgi:hypothetical protein
VGKYEGFAMVDTVTVVAWHATGAELRPATKEASMGRSILLWLLGVPIPIIILLALFWR